MGAGAYHEIALDKGQLIGKTLFRRVLIGSINLVVVVIETRNVGISECSDGSGRSPHSTANIQHLHALFDADLSRQIVFVPCNRLVEAFAWRKAAKMEALAPTVFIYVRRQIVVAVRYTVSRYCYSESVSKKHTAALGKRIQLVGTSHVRMS